MNLGRTVFKHRAQDSPSALPSPAEHSPTGLQMRSLLASRIVPARDHKTRTGEDHKTAQGRSFATLHPPDRRLPRALSALG